MTSYREAASGIDRRRLILGAGALASTGLVGVPTIAEARHRGRVLPAPEPIPGGNEFIPDQLFHVFAPGDPSVTLPFTGATLQGLDVEPGTVTDFRGSSAVAFHVGTARGHDGTIFDLETDMRAYEGQYVVDGTVYSGSFAFV
jgi:hypothetical protein